MNTPLYLHNPLYLWSSLSPSIRTSAFKLNESESFDFNPCALSSVPSSLSDRSRLSEVFPVPVSSFVPRLSAVSFLKSPQTLAQAQLPSLISAPVLKVENTMNQQEASHPWPTETQPCSTSWKQRTQWTNRKSLHLDQLRHSGRRAPWENLLEGAPLPLSRLLAPAGARPRRKRGHGCRAPGTHRGQAARSSSPPAALATRRAGTSQKGAGIWLFPGTAFPPLLSSQTSHVLWSEAFPHLTLNPFPLTSQSLPLP